MNPTRRCKRCGSENIRKKSKALLCRGCETIYAREYRDARGLSRPRLVSLPGEEWAVIAGFAGYEISTHGRVRNSLGRQVKSSLSKSFPYPTVQVRRMGDDGRLVAVAKAVHRLVALAFLGEPHEGATQVRHLDGCPTNPHISNLAWGTPRENVSDTLRHGRVPRGEAHCCAVLTDERVRLALKLVNGGMSQNKIAAQFGVNRKSISDLVCGKTWRHVTGKQPAECRGVADDLGRRLQTIEAIGRGTC